MKYAVAIVVDPEFENRLADLLERMPVSMADTETTARPLRVLMRREA